MVRNLLKKYNNLNKMKRGEVEKLLGKPDNTEIFTDYDYAYWLSPETVGLFPIDSEWLVIKFENDKVIRVDILSD